MTKLKIEHGVSRIRRAKLQASVDQSVADDIQSLADWSNNEPHYIVNQLLRFALTQEEDFQKYKASAAARSTQSTSNARVQSAPLQPVPGSIRKLEASSANTTAHV